MRKVLYIGVAILLVLAIVVVVVVMVGSQSEPLIAAEGELTCAECHLDRGLLQADLEADPLEVVEKAESEGEG